MQQKILDLIDNGIHSYTEMIKLVGKQNSNEFNRSWVMLRETGVITVVIRKKKIGKCTHITHHAFMSI